VTNALRANSIAIIGMAGRFPGANSIERFWSNVAQGVESITFFSDAELLAAGLDTTLYPVTRARAAGQILAANFADLALVPVTFTPYLSQTLSWYTMLLGPPGKNGSQDWTNYSNGKFDQLVQTASQQLNPNTAAGYYVQADTQLWDEMVSLPLFAEPTALAWSRTIGGVTPTPRSDAVLWFAQLWAVRTPESTSNTTPSLPGQ